MASVPGGGSFLNPLFQVVSFGAGTALGPVLRPVLQDLQNETWSLHPVRPPDALTLAQGVAEGQVDPAVAAAWAKQTGFDTAQFDALIAIAKVGPGSAYAFELWRRGLIDGAGFRRALKRLGIEDEWIAPLVGTRDILLTPAELAQARQRGFVDQARQYSEAELQGVTNDRAEIQFKSAGLPPPTERALSMWRRGIIDEATFKQTIVEGNEKLKYQDQEAALFRPLLTPGQIVNQRLRGWRDTAWMDARLAEHGFDAVQAQDMFEGQGRPISFHQVFIGLRRGGVYDGPTGAIEPAFLKSLQESNIRPEWYNIAWAQRYSYPSAFVLRALTQSGDLTQAQTEEILLFIGWPPALATSVSTRWSGGTSGATSDPLVKSARTTAITMLRNAFVARRIDEATVTARLTSLGIAADVQTPLIQTWAIMQTIPGAGLTRAQVKKAFKSLPAEWPRDRALTELEDLGMEPDEAQTYLDE
jgi:hypothetical protein